MSSNELIAAYAKNPPNKHAMDHADIAHREENRLCDDALTVFLVIRDGILQDASFTGETSMVTTACASLTLESLIGKNIEEILSLDEHYIRDELGLSVTHRRRQASVFGMLAIRNAIHRYRADEMTDDFASVMRG